MVKKSVSANSSDNSSSEQPATPSGSTSAEDASTSSNGRTPSNGSAGVAGGSEALIGGVAVPRVRVKHFFLVRESDEDGLLLLEGMLHQTLGPHRDIVGVADVLAAGVGPMSRDCGFEVYRSAGSKTKSAVFFHEGVGYFYVLGSAAALNTPAGQNAYSSLMIELIDQFKPEVLHVANFSRLVRSAGLSGSLMAAAERNSVTIDSGAGLIIDLHSSHGRLMWQVMTIITDIEREQINNRLFAGLVNKFTRGEWVLGVEAVPPGYKLVKNRLELDHESVPAVRQLIELLADDELSASEQMRLAGSLGLTSATARRHHGEQATWADLLAPSSKVRNLRDFVPLWSTGVHELRFDNPFRGAESFGSLKVQGANLPENLGYLLLPYQLELPEGGWGSPEVFTRIRNLGESAGQRRRRVGKSQTRQAQRPFSGWPIWADETFQYRVDATSGSYTVKRRPVAEAETAWTSESGSKGDRLASISFRQFHERFIDAVITAFQTGAGSQLVDGVVMNELSQLALSFSDAKQLKREHYAEQITMFERRYRNARDNANDAASSQEREEFLEDSQRARSELAAAKQQLELLEQTAERESLESFVTKPGPLLRAFTAIASDGSKGPAELAASLKQILRFTGLKNDPLTQQVTLQFDLLIPTAGRVARFGPINMTFNNLAYKKTLAREPVTDRAKAALAILVAPKAQAPDSAQATDAATAERGRRLADKVCDESIRVLLMQSGWTKAAATIASRSHLAPIYQIIANRLFPDATGNLATGLDQLDPAFVQHILDLYGSADFNWNSRHSLGCRDRQTMVDFVARSGGEVRKDHFDDFAKDSGVPKAKAVSCREEQARGVSPTWKPCLQPLGTWSPNTAKTERSLALIPCPHCGGHATKVVRTPETTESLLCPDCMRMPNPDSPIFPECYLDLP